ncbi:MAG: hypothetical protein M0P94_03520 [Candidatus Absconditabacterales bacterium]|nr:hypothetical protein [Candidatus Absconditabacterales bacterium]
MIEEIVRFSKELEKNDIYEIYEKKTNFFSRPIIVIPIDLVNKKIKVENIYLVLKKDNIKYFIEETKKNAINKKYCEIKKSDLNIKSFDEINQKFLKIVKSIDRFLNRINTNTCIGGAKGTLSYHTLCFYGKTGVKGIFSSKEIFKAKIEMTYKKLLIEKSIPDNLKEKSAYIDILTSISEKYEIIWEKIDEYINNVVRDNNKNKISEFTVLFEIPSENYSFYKTWFDFYFMKKLFAKDEPKKFFDNCYVPQTFNNLNEGKPFLRHLTRKNDINIVVSQNDSFALYKFDYYIPRLKLNLFPVFIVKEYKDKFYHLLKNNLKRFSFQEYMQNIFQNMNQDIFDFYLVRYIKKIDAPKKIPAYFDIDYISGYKLNFNNYLIFDIENIINDYFFDKSLMKNYFNPDINLDDKVLISLLYKYRNIIFDFFYRAKYFSLNLSIINNMFYEVFRNKLRKLYNVENKEVKNLIILPLEKYKEINKIFGGNFMETIDNIKNKEKIFDKESFAYFSGQLVYYLLSLSKAGKENKNHSMVEPFINVTNLGLLALRINELFSVYKHCIYINNSTFNNLYAQILSYVIDNEDELFSNHMKLFFYTGYFNSKENVMYKPTGGGNE